MSWYPQPPRDRIVDVGMNIFINAFIAGSAEDVIWSRPPTEFEPTARGTKTCHDAAMTNKVSRLYSDSPLLKPMTIILYSLPERQYHAILAKYLLVGLNQETATERWSDGKAWTDRERCKKVAQGYDEFRKNVERARAKVFEKLSKIV